MLWSSAFIRKFIECILFLLEPLGLLLSHLNIKKYIDLNNECINLNALTLGIFIDYILYLASSC